MMTHGLANFEQYVGHFSKGSWCAANSRSVRMRRIHYDIQVIIH